MRGNILQIYIQHTFICTHTVSMLAKSFMYHGYWRGGHEPLLHFFQKSGFGLTFNHLVN